MLESFTSAGLVAELHRKVGRNLLRFQELEFQLKFVMPYIHPDARVNGIDTFKAMREDLGSRPLGALIEKFSESVQTDKPEQFAEELNRILDARNQLVHHFFQLPGVDFMTLDGVRAAIRYLDEQFDSAQSLHEMVRSQSAAVLYGILSSPGYENSDLALHRAALLKAVGPDVEIVNAGDPSRTVWQTTRLVQLLKLAEQETEPFDGMTLLSRAGQLIRQTAPELSPKTYGLRRLTDVLLASGLFEVDLRPNDDNGSLIVLYRSLDSASPALTPTDDRRA